MTAVIRHRQSDISYEIICTAPRMADTTEYLLLEPHPARKIPTTPMDEMAVSRNTPTLKSRITAPLFHGRNEKAPTEPMITSSGATIYRNLSALSTKKISLMSIFSTSANTCSKPQKPTRIGPNRHWK